MAVVIAGDGHQDAIAPDHAEREATRGLGIADRAGVFARGIEAREQADIGVDPPDELVEFRHVRHGQQGDHLLALVSIRTTGIDDDLVRVGRDEAKIDVVVRVVDVLDLHDLAERQVAGRFRAEHGARPLPAGVAHLDREPRFVSLFRRDGRQVCADDDRVGLIGRVLTLEGDADGFPFAFQPVEWPHRLGAKARQATQCEGARRRTRHRDVHGHIWLRLRAG